MDRFREEIQGRIRDQKGSDGDQDDGERDQRDDDEIRRLGRVERDIVIGKFLYDLPEDTVPFAPALILHGRHLLSCFFIEKYYHKCRRDARNREYTA